MLSLGFRGASDSSGTAPAPGPVARGASAEGGSGSTGGYAVVDVEATGSSSRRHRIVEIAVVLLDRARRPQGEFSTLVDPEGPVGPTHIHGIEQHHLIPAPRFAQIAPRLLGLLRGRVLVGHNVGCDRAFLAAEYARVGVELPPAPELCTMRLAEQHFPSSPYGLSLRACAAAAGVPAWAAHTALGDARASGQLFARCAPVDGGELAEAQALEWPRMPEVPQGDVLWVGRASVPGARGASGAGCPAGRSRVPKSGATSASQAVEGNVPASRMVSFVRNGGA